MGLVNLNSLGNKLAFVRHLIESKGLCMLAVCETWLTSSTPTSFVDLEGLSFFRKDMQGTVAKHGVGLYVDKKLNPVLDEIDVPNVVAVYIESWDLHVISCYRPLHTPLMKILAW